MNGAVRLIGGDTVFMVITQNSASAFTLDAAVDPVYLDLTWAGPSS